VASDKSKARLDKRAATLVSLSRQNVSDERRDQLIMNIQLGNEVQYTLEEDIKTEEHLVEGGVKASKEDVEEGKALKIGNEVADSGEDVIDDSSELGGDDGSVVCLALDESDG